MLNRFPRDRRCGKKDFTAENAESAEKKMNHIMTAKQILRKGSFYSLCSFLCALCVLCGEILGSSRAVPVGDALQAGFAETDITPQVKEKTVFMAGFGHNRKATGVHDPLKARAVVFKHGEDKIALVAIDLIGFFHPRVESVRQRLPGFRY